MTFIIFPFVAGGTDIGLRGRCKWRIFIKMLAFVVHNDMAT